MQTLTDLLPPKYAAYAAIAIILLQTAGRVYHALASGHGLTGAWRAFLYGNPKPPGPQNPATP
ncbi:MAG: hypothetical protein ABSE16_14665 [Verrucomicrobiota bacterium]|jgi:hypothetical protein